MFKYTITYTDYNGNEQNQDLYFNISKAEMIKLQFSMKGGFDQYLQGIVNRDNPDEILNAFTQIVDLSYGVKSEDGTRFVKNEEVLKEFTETPAYSEFIMALLTEEGLSDKFINGIVPVDTNQAKNFVPQN